MSSNADKKRKICIFLNKFLHKYEVGMHSFAQKFAFLKGKEAFNQSILVKMSKDCIH
jgi:hypothetical protein